MDDETRRLFEEGNQYRLNGAYDAAQPLLEQAVRCSPEEGICWWALAHVMLNIGEFDEAISRFRKAAELEPTNQRFLVDLAKSLEMLGEYDQARPILERVLEVDPTTREAEEARRSLKFYSS